MPLTLTVLSAAVPPRRRGLALGIWGGISGLAVALGPLVGGAIVTGLSWHWIFWLNVPIGLALVPLILLRLERRADPRCQLDLLGLALGSAGLVGIVWGLVRANEGLDLPPIVGAFVLGGALLASFVAWELRTEQPMLPMRFFRNRTFALANVVQPAHVLRDVRLDLLHRAVLPDRAGPLAVSVGASGPALDGDADARRADRRRTRRTASVAIG